MDFGPRSGRRSGNRIAGRFARTFGGWIANHVALVFIEVIRGTPIVVQVMFIYFALPMAFNDLRIDPFTAAVVTIMINSGAYIAEITRGAVLSIHKGFVKQDWRSVFTLGNHSLRHFTAGTASYAAAAG